MNNLWIYPVKSCAAVDVKSAYAAKLGLQNEVLKDRYIYNLFYILKRFSNTYKQDFLTKTTLLKALSVMKYSFYNTTLIVYSQMKLIVNFIFCDIL